MVLGLLIAHINEFHYTRVLISVVVLQEDAELLKAAIDESYRIKDLVRSLQDFNQPSSGKIAVMDMHKALDARLKSNKGAVGHDVQDFAAMPGAAILIVSLGFNLLGDGLRDALDPKEAGQ